MGAVNFTKLTVGQYKDAAEAYNTLVAEAKHTYGHDGYNGTISTTDGFYNLTAEAPAFGSKAWDAWVEQLFASEKYIQKWGTCVCVQITGAALKKLKAEAGIKPGERGNRAFVFIGIAAE
jgi:hypothetical protein